MLNTLTGYEMAIGNTYNQTSLQIADKQFKAKLRSPSIKQKQIWHEEFLESAQYKMSWLTFLKSKTKSWQKEKRIMAQKQKHIMAQKQKHIMAAQSKKQTPAT